LKHRADLAAEIPESLEDGDETTLSTPGQTLGHPRTGP
jgi:hypothetical protein